jgi:hypothetical protein
VRGVLLRKCERIVLRSALPVKTVLFFFCSLLFVAA